MRRRHGNLAGRARVGGLALETLETRCVPTGLAIGDVVVTEGTSGTKFVEVPVTRAAPATKTVQVDFQTVAGSARVGSDFTAVSGTLTFAPGERTKTISIRVLGDTTPEHDEMFRIFLFNATGALLMASDAAAEGFIFGKRGTPPGEFIG